MKTMYKENYINVHRYAREKGRGIERKRERVKMRGKETEKVKGRNREKEKIFSLFHRKISRTVE